jgi:adenylosuccinate lyase
MIERYTRAEIGQIWSEENKIRKWLEVELAVLEALARYRYIPKDIPGKVRTKANFSVKRIKEIESRFSTMSLLF